MLSFLLLLVAAAAIVTIAVHFATGVPPFPALPAEKAVVVELLRRAKLRPGSTVYELGCGWGGLLMRAARRYPQQNFVGIELSPLPFAVSWLRSLLHKNVTVQWANFHKADLSDSGAVICYLMRGPMPKLAKKLDSELLAGTPVIALAFLFTGRKQAISCPGKGLLRAAAALYRWPAKRTGQVHLAKD